MRLLCLAAAGVVTLSAGGPAYSYFCQQRCGDEFINGCTSEEKCSLKENCSEIALVGFTQKDGVCQAFSDSGPVCDSKTRICYEASDFQLVWDRHKDFEGDYSMQNWDGIQKEFHDAAAIFIPGGSNFLFQMDIAQTMEALHKKHDGLVKPLLKQVLTSGQPDFHTIHATGFWSVNGSNGTSGNTLEDLPFYARWIQNPNGHWVVETLLVDAGEKSLKALASAAPRDEELFLTIANRSAEYTKAYNAGDFDKVSSFYFKDAVIVPRSERPFMQSDIKAKKSFLGSNAKLDSKIVMQAPGNSAVHEIGFSSSTGTGYLGRWVQSVSSEWLLESHVFTVFPKATSEILI